MIEVLKSGIYDTIQDLGRFGVQGLGVPHSGVMDVYSAKRANHIMGNPESSPLLEITITGPKLKFHSNTEIVLSGADISPNLNSEPIGLHKQYTIKKGDVLSFGRLNSGCRCYLAVKGGFKSEYILNSYSMFAPITAASRLKKGDVLDLPLLDIISVPESNASILRNASNFDTKIIEVYKGMEFNLLPIEMKKQLFSMDFTISSNSNRMAYQFNELLENSLESIITSFVLPGSVQLTPSGQLLILMRDCQTTGGYPRILQVSESSINILAQKTFGEKIKFKCLN